MFMVQQPQYLKTYKKKKKKKLSLKNKVKFVRVYKEIKLNIKTLQNLRQGRLHKLQSNTINGCKYFVSMAAALDCPCILTWSTTFWKVLKKYNFNYKIIKKD